MSDGRKFLDRDGHPTLWTFVGDVYEAGAAFGDAALHYDSTALRPALLALRAACDAALAACDD